MTRILIFTLALLSAFFVSAFDKAQVDAKKSSSDIGYCYFGGDSYAKVNVDAGGCISHATATYKLIDPTSEYGAASLQQVSATKYNLFIRWLKRKGCESDCGTPFDMQIGYYRIDGSTETSECPPDGNPDFSEMFTYVNPDTGQSTDKCKMPGIGENCPMPSDNDSFAIAASNKSICYNNPDGSVCQYDQKAGQVNYVSSLYGSNEPKNCGDGAGDESEPPAIPPPEPIQPPNGTGGDHTLPPQGEDADPSPSQNEQEALDKINKNLKAITDNQQKYGDKFIESQNSQLNELKLTNKYNEKNLEMTDAIRIYSHYINKHVETTAKNTTNLVAIETDNNRQLRANKDELRKLNATATGIKGDTGQLVTIAGEGNELIKTLIDKMPCNPEKETCPEPTPPPVPECDPEKELCKGSVKAPNEKDFDKTLSASFWESQYENGLQGVWDEKAEELKNTGAIKFIEQFKVSASGSLPDLQICFNLGPRMDFGCKALPMPDSRVLAFIKLCILITAAFACRRIIFGG